VERLAPRVRDRRASYRQSLDVVAHYKRGGMRTKSSIMLGLGETREEVISAMRDLRSVGCDILTLGQYLRPTEKHLPVEEYVRPEVFRDLEQEGLALGFRFVAAGPLVRSSYKAGEFFVQRWIEEERKAVAAQ
jgi:lipoic acid synthetase